MERFEIVVVGGHGEQQVVVGVKRADGLMGELFHPVGLGCCSIPGRAQRSYSAESVTAVPNMIIAVSLSLVRSGQRPMAAWIQSTPCKRATSGNRMVCDERLDCAARMRHAGDSGATPGDGALFVRCEGWLPPLLGANAPMRSSASGPAFTRKVDPNPSIRTPTGQTEVKTKGLPRIGLVPATPFAATLTRSRGALLPQRVLVDRAGGSDGSGFVARSRSSPSSRAARPFRHRSPRSRLSRCPRWTLQRPSGRRGSGSAWPRTAGPGSLPSPGRSIRSQTNDEWVCYVSDDHSSDAAWEAIPACRRWRSAVRSVPRRRATRLLPQLRASPLDGLR